ncbi:putative MATE family efflux protein [Hoeflea halophila]|uniref:Putative MATE family efflux protein n=1 Tax=Hoeflea halophila TaxID=714899 RepID=A0A286IFX4_9HYPH|nr:MATE family efflux transporter [Hoeflea halophila]SOE19000.1 putative MATE family efflux protein [Hoeflea halophila]
MAGKDLTSGPVWKALARISAPMSLGIFAVLSVGVADAYFLGQLGGTPLAAIGFIFPVTATFASLAIGLSAGANATVSQSIGGSDAQETTARYAMHAFGLGVVMAATAALLVWATYPLLFRLIGAKSEVLGEIALYMPFWALSFPLLVSLMITNAIFRAYGSGTVSALLMVLAAVINIVLNPLLIFGWGPIPGLGTEGAAISSAVGRGAAAIIGIIYALRRGYLDFAVNIFKDLWESLGQLLRVGVPAALSNAINPAGMVLVTAAVATLGDAAVAGFGAATRVQSVALVPLLALSSGIGPVVGQNWGARSKDRARAAVRQSWLICLIYGALLGTALFLFGERIALAIAPGAEAGKFTQQYLTFVGWSLFGYGILVTANAAMNARSKALHSMSLSLGRIFLIYLPLAWAGVWLFGYTGILMAAIAANVFAALGALVAARAVGLFRSRHAVITEPARLVPT